MRIARLDGAPTDHTLATETLTALLNDRKGLLVDYVRENSCATEPVRVARAIMIAGFCDESPLSHQVLNEYTQNQGLLGKSCAAARYAYERNKWGL